MLVVAEPDIIVRLQLLDQVAFEDQRFQLAVGHHQVDVGDAGNHPARFRRVRRRLLEIRADAVAQVHCFTDVKDLSFGVFIDIAAGAGRQRAEFFLDLLWKRHSSYGYETG